MQRVAVVLEVGPDLVLIDVRLAHQQHVAAAPAGVLAQRVQPALPVAGVDVDAADLLAQERHGVHAEAGHAEREPEPDRLDDLVADGRIGDVQVGLEGREAVQVVLARAVVPGPVVLRRALLASRIVGPHVVVAKRRRAALPRGDEPGVLDRRVVDHEVREHAQTVVGGVADRLDDVAEVPEPVIDGEIVGDVVAVVLVGGRVQGHQPHARRPELRDVVDPLDEARDVAAPVAVGVAERLDVQAVDDRVLPPQVAGRSHAHRLSERPWRRRRSRSGAASLTHYPGGWSGTRAAFSPPCGVQPHEVGAAARAELVQAPSVRGRSRGGTFEPGHGRRSVRNSSRSSEAYSSGCSQAAKWPPRSTSL